MSKKYSFFHYCYERDMNMIMYPYLYIYNTFITFIIFNPAEPVPIMNVGMGSMVLLINLLAHLLTNFYLILQDNSKATCVFSAAFR